MNASLEALRELVEKATDEVRPCDCGMTTEAARLGSDHSGSCVAFIWQNNKYEALDELDALAIPLARHVLDLAVALEEEVEDHKGAISIGVYIEEVREGKRKPNDWDNLEVPDCECSSCLVLARLYADLEAHGLGASESKETKHEHEA